MKIVFLNRVEWCASFVVVASFTSAASLAEDIEFLKEHTGVLVMHNKARTVQVAVAARMPSRELSSVCHSTKALQHSASYLTKP